MDKHPTENVVIQQIPVDVEIVPIINWLNGMSGIKTLFCCQGEDEPETRSQIPYVLFACDWDMKLVKVLRAVTAFGGNFSRDIAIEIDYLNERCPIRYNIRWRNKMVMNRFAEFIKKPEEEIETLLMEREKSLTQRVWFNQMFGVDLNE